jgi:hypothetical protein
MRRTDELLFLDFDGEPSDRQKRAGATDDPLGTPTHGQLRLVPFADLWRRHGRVTSKVKSLSVPVLPEICHAG